MSLMFKKDLSLKIILILNIRGWKFSVSEEHYFIVSPLLARAKYLNLYLENTKSVYYIGLHFASGEHKGEKLVYKYYAMI